MLTTVKVDSSIIDKLKRRVVKFIRMGNSDVQTSIEANAFGIDSNAPAEMIALYAESSIKGKNYIIGYLNKNQLAETGEVRIYSVDANGNQKFYTWLKNDGTYEIGGNVDNAVRYAKLEAGLNSMVNLINENLPLIATGIATGGGAYTPINITLDISEAKIAEVKTS